MDEKTLNYLLECSVCLERLDLKSKVLPCQHTFCRKCLEIIVKSHNELRCPECRVLIEVRIDDLPPNVLLMRILEGMKNHSSTNNTLQILSASSVAATSTTAIVKQQQQIQNIRSPAAQNKLLGGTGDHQQQQPIQPQIIRNNYPNNKFPSTGVPHAKALYDFTSKESGDLSFKSGDIILMRKILDHNWCIGEFNGREGAFPINHVEVKIPLPSPQCKSLYDFRMGPNEDEGCLLFKKGAVINVMRRVDSNWAEGRINDSIGIFPIAFVEMNSTARQLMDASAKHIQHSSSRIVPPKPFESTTSSDSSSTTTSPISSSNSNTSSNSSTAPNSPTSNLTAGLAQLQLKQQQQLQNQQSQIIQHRDKKEKRHSLTALISNNHINQNQSNRHSVEILNPPDRTASIQTTIDNKSSSSIPSSNQPPPHNRTKQGTARFNHFPVVCEALYPYTPQNTDELELKKGSVYFVTERCEDGWLKGSNRAKKTGVFPGNYVVPLSRNHIRENSSSQRIAQVNSGPSSVPGLINYPSPSGQIVVPPELPPRNNSPSSSSSALHSVWTKPLNHVDALFNRKVTQTSSNNQIKNDKGSVVVGSSQTTTAGHNNNTPVKKESSSSSAVSLMKRLTNMKSSKSPATNQYSMDNPVFEDNIISSSAVQSKLHPVAHHVHVRSGSCPSQLLHNLPLDAATATGNESTGGFLFGSKRIKNKERPSLHELRSNTTETGLAKLNKSVIPEQACVTSSSTGPSVSSSSGNTNHIKQQSTVQPVAKMHSSAFHRKSQSLDANTLTAHINTGGGNNGGTPLKNKGHSHSRERFRCIVPYPPNSEYELELHIGDIVFVHKKRENGWYKGTHHRTGKTGLFPASFVEPDI